MNIENTRADKSWLHIFNREPVLSHLRQIFRNLENEYAMYTVFPPEDLLFNAFRLTSFENVKVVIVGQDPYHDDKQAHGLSFSVPEGIARPRSLQNIFKELNTDLGISPPVSGDLTPWAQQGVLLLNTFLTVRAHQPKSHHRIGWEKFTDSIIGHLSAEKNHLIFLLWGNDAIKKSSLIDNQNHLILTAAHPSPLSASRGFFGCRHFSKTNQYLQQHGITPINWKI